MKLVLNVMLCDLNIALLCILKRLRFLLTALGLLIKPRGYTILDIRNTEEEGRVAKHCIEMENVGNLKNFLMVSCHIDMKGDPEANYIPPLCNLHSRMTYNCYCDFALLSGYSRCSSFGWHFCQAS